MGLPAFGGSAFVFAIANTAEGQQGSQTEILRLKGLFQKTSFDNMVTQIASFWRQNPDLKIFNFYVIGAGFRSGFCGPFSEIYGPRTG